jgi:hypothetical protein
MAQNRRLKMQSFPMSNKKSPWCGRVRNISILPTGIAAFLLEKETLTLEIWEPLLKRISLTVPDESQSRAPSLLRGKGG